MILYAIVSFAKFMEDCDILRQMEYLEVAAHRGGSLDIDEDFYTQIEANDGLKIIVGYDDDVAVCYTLIVIHQLPHDAERVCASTDLIFVHPEYRKQRLGISLYKMAEVELSLSIPGALWRSSMTLDGLSEKKKRGGLTALGFKPTELVYEKVIGD